MDIKKTAGLLVSTSGCISLLLMVSYLSEEESDGGYKKGSSHAEIYVEPKRRVEILKPVLSVEKLHAAQQLHVTC